MYPNLTSCGSGWVGRVAIHFAFWSLFSIIGIFLSSSSTFAADTICVTPGGAGMSEQTYPLVKKGPHKRVVGTITVSNTQSSTGANKLVVTIKADKKWTLVKSQVEYGTKKTDFHLNRYGIPQTNLYRYQNSTVGSMQKYTIPLTILSGTILVSVHADVKPATSITSDACYRDSEEKDYITDYRGNYYAISVWGQGTRFVKYSKAMYFNYVVQECAVPTANLTLSPSNLALSVNNTTLNPALTGNPRTLTITNQGPATALNVTYSLSGLPGDATITSTPNNGAGSCGDIPNGGQCVITITPGATPSTLPGLNPPTPMTLGISATNLAPGVPPNATVNILSYGSVYQSGFVYAIDDTILTGSVGGSLAGLTDSSPVGGIIWSTNGTAGVASNSFIAGILVTSTNPPDACNGKTEGLCNSSVILAFYSPTTTYPLNFYATGLCELDTDGGYTDWYLPAICELGYRGNDDGSGGGGGGGGNPGGDSGTIPSGCGTLFTPLIQNMQSNLVNLMIPGAPSGTYWSSTAHPTNATGQNTVFRHITSNSDQRQVARSNLLGVRCSRFITP